MTEDLTCVSYSKVWYLVSQRKAGSWRAQSGREAGGIPDSSKSGGVGISPFWRLWKFLTDHCQKTEGGKIHNTCVKFLCLLKHWLQVAVKTRYRATWTFGLIYCNCSNILMVSDSPAVMVISLWCYKMWLLTIGSPMKYREVFRRSGGVFHYSVH